MADVEGSHAVEVAAPLRECAAAIDDVERYPEWYDTIDSVEVLERDAEGRPEVAAFTVGAGPLGAVEFTLRLERPGPGRLIGAQVAGNGRVEQVRMQWTLDGADDAHTSVVYGFSASASGVRTRVALRAARPLVERDLIRKPAEALKRRLEGRATA